MDPTKNLTNRLSDIEEQILYMPGGIIEQEAKQSFEKGTELLNSK